MESGGTIELLKLVDMKKTDKLAEVMNSLLTKLDKDWRGWRELQRPATDGLEDGVHMNKTELVGYLALKSGRRWRAGMRHIAEIHDQTYACLLKEGPHSDQFHSSISLL
jgi:hypothetical protein